jgi:hypothetical protein
MRTKYNNELKDHKLICGWCQQGVSLEDVQTTHKVSKRDRFTYSCEHCTRRSEIKVGVLGFYSLYSYNKNKYYREKVCRI